MKYASRWYARLLKLYPAGFRETYEVPMERQFRDEWRDARTIGEKAMLCVRTTRDILATAPVESALELAADLRHAGRIYRRRAGVTVTAVLVLALAIGASSGVFGVLSALLLRNLPFDQPEKLVEVFGAPVTVMQGRAAFKEWRSRSPYLSDAAGYAASEMNVYAGSDQAIRVSVAETSANFFDLLGVRPAVGRTFQPDEDLPGRGEVAVVSYRLARRLSGEADATGSVLRVNGTAFTVVGVAPPGFDFPGGTAVWLPSVYDVEVVPKTGPVMFNTIGRLQPGRAVDQANALLRAERRQAGIKDPPPEELQPSVWPLREKLAGPVRHASAVLGAMILLVLLTACANAAHLLLSRSTERRHELAVRAAMGASRARLLQQVVTESAALTTVSALLGLGVAWWVTRLAASVIPAKLETQQYTILDWRVLGFAAALAIGSGVLIGCISLWSAGRQRGPGFLRVQVGNTDRSTRRLRFSLVAVQAAITLTLLAGAVIMGRTFVRLAGADLGMETRNVVSLGVSLEGTWHAEAPWRFHRAALERLRAVPGVEAAGGVTALPLTTQAYMIIDFELDSGQKVPAIITAMTPGYLRAIGTPIVAGADLDVSRRESAVIVNEAFARATGLGPGVLGRRIKTPWQDAPYEIVGVARTVMFRGPGDESGAQIFFSAEEEPTAKLTYVARVRGRAAEVLARCRDAVRGTDREVALFDAKTLEQRHNEVLAVPRAYTAAVVFLAGLATLLAIAGVYGAAAYGIVQRHVEIGIRMALGATLGHARSMVLRESLVPLIGGVAVGVAGALAAGRLLRYLESTAEPVDVGTCVAAGVVLLLVGLGAAWRATRRLGAVNPADVVRAL